VDAVEETITDGATLTGSDLAIMKAVKIDMVCIKVITAAPLGDFVHGPINEKDAKAAELKAVCDKLQKGVDEGLDLIGYAMPSMWSVSSAGGADYHPDNRDNTNIDYSVSEELSRWA